MAGGSFFSALAGDERTIKIDCDVMLGYWPPRADLDLRPAAVAEILARGRIESALVTSAQGVYFDEAAGCAESLEWAAAQAWRPCPAVNLRDAWGIAERLDAWLAAGVRAIRLAGLNQQVPTSAPGYRLVVREAAARGLVMLVEGGFNQVQHDLRGLDAKIIFTDISYHETADFLIAALDEPGFVASTRRLLGPDSLEIICGEVGAAHLVFGSGSPLQDLEVSEWRLRDARLSEAEFDQIAGGTISALMATTR